VTVIVPRNSCTFRKRDVQMAIAAARAAGLEITQVRIRRDGTIEIVSKMPIDNTTDTTTTNEWDELL
jgi:hypothetical protein